MRATDELIDDIEDGDRAAWLAHPVTAHARRAYTEARNVHALQLLSYARQSADPAVRACVAALEQSDAILYGVGGERFKDKFPVKQKEPA